MNQDLQDEFEAEFNRQIKIVKLCGHYIQQICESNKWNPDKLFFIEQNVTKIQQSIDTMHNLIQQSVDDDQENED